MGILIISIIIGLITALIFQFKERYYGWDWSMFLLVWFTGFLSGIILTLFLCIVMLETTSSQEIIEETNYENITRIVERTDSDFIFNNLGPNKVKLKIELKDGTTVIIDKDDINDL